MIKTARLLFLCSIVLATSGYSAIVDIENGTFSSAPDEVIQSITIGGVVYSELIGATVSNTPTSSEYYYDVTNPMSENAALSGLSATSGTLNTSNGTNFFIYNDGGVTTLTSTDLLFVLEYDFSTEDNAQFDDVSFGLIDSTGSLIGDYSIEIVDIGDDAPGTLLDTGALTRESGNSFLNENLYGTGFLVSDFTGTTGDISQAVGIQLLNNNLGLGGSGGSIDIASVGLAAIPEPSSLVLFCLGAIGVFVVKFSKSRS